MIMHYFKYWGKVLFFYVCLITVSKNIVIAGVDILYH